MKTKTQHATLDTRATSTYTTTTTITDLPTPNPETTTRQHGRPATNLVPLDYAFEKFRSSAKVKEQSNSLSKTGRWSGKRSLLRKWQCPALSAPVDESIHRYRREEARRGAVVRTGSRSLRLRPSQLSEAYNFLMKSPPFCENPCSTASVRYPLRLSSTR
ncbi:hypothetical protein J6590_011384 [Homalodisca vitripennis]|nr:hypothetical protein J6590_011384 [Homalodisca vitripennis]